MVKNKFYAGGKDGLGNWHFSSTNQTLDTLNQVCLV
jgi:GTPase involved in cell partitioning and DNA repair